MPQTEGSYYVYVLFRPWDGSPLYVGKGKGQRWLDHERKKTGHRNKHLINTIRKAKAAGLEIPKIKVRENITNDEAIEIEIALIAAIGREEYGGPLVNLTDGGEGTSGIIMSAEAREKNRQTRLALWLTPEYRDAMIALRQTPEHRAKLKGHRPGQWNEEQRAAAAERARTQKKSKRSPETRAKMSAFALTPEGRAMKSAAAKARWTRASQGG